MRQSAAWQQGTAAAAAAYCSTLLPVCQALQAVLQAALQEVLSSPQLAPLAADAVLMTLELAACLQPLQGTAVDQNAMIFIQNLML